MSGTLYVVATPIGNLDDLSPRARQILAEADLIASEDTRHTGRLLSHIGAKTSQIALHDHNEDVAAAKVIDRMLGGESVAIVSDAGTPLISDPGFRLVALAHENEIPVVPVPGPSAVIAALSASGLPTDRFCFEGFAPHKQAARQKWFQRLASEPGTIVFFESVHRISGSFADLEQAFGPDRRAFVGRELTKLHEQCVNGSIGNIRKQIDAADIPSKGEFVIVIEGCADPGDRDLDADWLLTELMGLMPGKQAAAIAAGLTGGKRNDLYQRMLELRKK